MIRLPELGPAAGPLPDLRGQRAGRNAPAPSAFITRSRRKAAAGLKRYGFGLPPRE